MIGVETLVIGGGASGSATACGLACLGHDVVLLERSGSPQHKVCGEFLSAETQILLRWLGIEASALGAVPIEQVVVHSSRHHIALTLPFQAQSLSRYRLDDALLTRARAKGARVTRGVAAKAAVPNGSGWVVSCDNGDSISCRNMVLATGKLGMRGVQDTRNGALVGLKMHLRLPPEIRRHLERRVELFFQGESYIGLELVEDGIANLCLVLPRTTISRNGSGWPALRAHLAGLLPTMAERLVGAEPLWEKPKAVTCPIGGYLHRERKAAVYRVGDRLAHIPPFTGDGIAVALGSAALAVEHIHLGLPPDVYLDAARQLTAGPVRFAGIVSHLLSHGRSANLMFAAAARMPKLIRTVIRKTRLPLAADER